jgi:hypothetical protein
MGQRANITLTDAAGTPVNHVYKPTQEKGGVLYWKDTTVTSVDLGRNTLSLLQKVPGAQARVYKDSWKLVCPTLEQTSPSTSTGIQPAPTLAYENIFSMDLVFSERSTLQERKDILAMARDLIDEALITAQAEDLEITY